MISFLPCFLVELILRAMAKGTPLSCESQGVLRVAACESSFMAVFFAPSVSACGRCWMLMDGACWWCSTWCCLIFLLTGIWHGDSKSAGKDALLLHTFTGTSLACYKLVCFWWLCMLSFLSLFVFGKERGISSKKMTKARKDFIHKSRQRKNATEDESNLPHMLASRWKQPATHACKLVFTNTRQAAGDNERQQENEESGQQKTDEYCSRNRWMEIAIEQLRTLD